MSERGSEREREFLGEVSKLGSIDLIIVTYCDMI